MTTLAGNARTRTVRGMITPAQKGRRGRRGAQLIEFAITLPLFLMMLLFALDMGRIVFLSGVLHDAAFTSARAGAQVGGGVTNVTGVQSNTSQVAFEEAMEAIPGNSVSEFKPVQVVTGQTCSRQTGHKDNYVTVNVSHDVDFITPGLNSLLNIFQGQGNSWELDAVGVARCEVTRS